MALENDTLLMAPTSSRGNHNPARGMLSVMKKANGMLSAYIGDVLYPLVIAASRGMSTVVKKANGMLSAYIGDALYPLMIAAAQGMHTACLLESGADKSCSGTCHCYMLIAEEANGLNDHNMDGLRDIIAQLDPFTISNDS
eukprot:scaffold144409_cov30-Cyclotella_meneghiniana.AAC.1